MYRSADSWEGSKAGELPPARSLPLHSPELKNPIERHSLPGTRATFPLRLMNGLCNDPSRGRLKTAQDNGASS
jgi:hypothetical protein